MCTILFTHPFDKFSWRNYDLDQVLIAGDDLYIDIRKYNNSSVEFLEVHDLPPYICLSSEYFVCKVKKTYSGAMNPNYTDNYPLVKLEMAIGVGLPANQEEFQYSIFICKGNAKAICYHLDFFSFLIHMQEMGMDVKS